MQEAKDASNIDLLIKKGYLTATKEEEINGKLKL
jgi:hypothetical protein